MRAGDVFMETLTAWNTKCIFGNPGSTENSVLDRLANYPDLTYYMTLHESVAVGAAMYYAQATGQTGVVNLHVAPGLGNAIGMMYDALKSNTPLIVTSGKQDTRLQLHNALFSDDLVSMAAPVTKWSAELQSGEDVALLINRAFEIAQTPPRGPVFLSLPVNIMEQEVKNYEAVAVEPSRYDHVDYAAVNALADLILSSDRPAIVVGDEIAWYGASDSLVTLSEQIGACVLREFIHSQSTFPTQHPNFRGRLPTIAKGMRGLAENFDLMILIGGQFFEELWFDDVEPFPAATRIVRIEQTQEALRSFFRVDMGVVGSLAATVNELNKCLNTRISAAYQMRAASRNKSYNDGFLSIRQAMAKRLKESESLKPMSSLRAAHEIRCSLPENAIIIDESLTATVLDVSDAEDALAPYTYNALLELDFNFRTPGDFYAGRGGGLGQAMSGAIGLQVANPGRRVVALIGDGSAMYAPQSLWTAAHYQLPIIFIVFSNREYRVLKHNMDMFRQRYNLGGNRPYPNMNLADPQISFGDLARSMGVVGELVNDPAQIAAAMKKALSQDRPYLIEVEVAGKP